MDKSTVQQLIGKPGPVGAWSTTWPFPPASKRAVFLDRDGVICYNRPEHVKSWSEFQFLPRALESLQQLATTSLRIVVITNQAAVNRQQLSVETLQEIHRRMVSQIQAGGGRVDAIYYCPHLPEEHCHCRKPQPGLLWQAAREWDLDLQHSYLIGDAESDLLAGAAAGCPWRYLVLTGRGKEQLYQCRLHGERNFTVVPDLYAAVQVILRQEQAWGLLSSWQRSYV